MNIYEDYNRAKKVNRQLAITLISSHVSVRDFIKLGAVILHTCILLRLPLYFGLKPITHIIRPFITFRVIYYIWGLNNVANSYYNHTSFNSNFDTFAQKTIHVVKWSTCGVVFTRVVFTRTLKAKRIRKVLFSLIFEPNCWSIQKHKILLQEK